METQTCPPGEIKSGWTHMKIGPTDANNRSKVDAQKSPGVKRLYSKCEINNIDKK